MHHGALIGGALIGVYRTATALFEPAASIFLRRRLGRGKEDPDRLGERLGHAKRPRPPGPLVWLHGASVGEGLAVLPLVDRLVARGVGVLVTTGTVSSARILAARLPPGALHQFLPLDIPAAMRRFLVHWRPDVALLAESELWPNLMLETAGRGIPLVLVNARLSTRSFARWRRMPRFIGELLGLLSLCLAQSEEDAGRLRALGAPRVTVAGNLKFDAAPPPADAGALEALARAIGERPTWLAASTHSEEEAAVLDAHAAAATRHAGLLTIVVPRQAERGGPIAEAAEARGLVVARRSRGQPIEAGTHLYVADTMGELGLFYRLVRIVFVGKSLGGGGGQNPIEPAKFGCAILHGPHVANFLDVYRLLAEADAAREVADPAGLAAALVALLGDAAAQDRLGAAAMAAVAGAGGAADRVMQAIEPLLAARIGARA